MVARRSGHEVVSQETDDYNRMERTGQLPAFQEQQQLRVALRAALKKYVDVARDGVCCLHCGAAQRRAYGHCNVIWHHPDNDGHLGRVSDLVRACATIAEIDTEIARCVPLCNSCHMKEHSPIRGRDRNGRHIASGGAS